MKMLSLKKRTLFLGKKTHKIYTGPHAIHQIGEWLEKQPSKKAFIIADKRLEFARRALSDILRKNHWEVHEILVTSGEGLKNFKTIYPLYAVLFEKKANRDSVVFALGGGSVGDAAGFIASTYLRGISWVGIPTTLLAQVDSAIGGKTGLNHISGKNLIGSFYHPALVVCDTCFLKTLEQRDIVSGFGEMVKYGLVFDPVFFNYLKKHISGIFALDFKILSNAIDKCLFWKAKIISKDAFDRIGIREYLNFGHTFAHALESLTEYKKYRHGEAVIWGMRYALALSEIRKKIEPKKRLELDLFLSLLKVPPLPSSLNWSLFTTFIYQDKKIRGGKLHFVLLEDLGKPISDSMIGRKDLYRAYRLLKRKVNHD